MKELPSRIIPRRRFLQLAVLGTVAVPISLTLGCEKTESEKVIDDFDFQFANKLLGIINDERIERDLPPLVQHSGLIQAAKEHAKEMAQNNYLEHESLDRSSHIDRIAGKGFHPDLLITENIIRGAIGRSAIDKPFEYHEDFMTSDEGHRENILEPRFQLVGIGCYVKNSTRWCVVDFVGVP